MGTARGAAGREKPAALAWRLRVVGRFRVPTVLGLLLSLALPAGSSATLEPGASRQSLRERSWGARVSVRAQPAWKGGKHPRTTQATILGNKLFALAGLVPDPALVSCLSFPRQGLPLEDHPGRVGRVWALAWLPPPVPASSSGSVFVMRGTQ